MSASKKVVAKALLITIALIVSVSIVSASKPIVFKTNQSEYYFLTGEDAVISFDVENFRPVSGQMTYTITQKISQQGFQYTSTNTRSSPVKIENDTFIVNFGTSKDPAEFDVSMDLVYEGEDGNVYVSFPDIKIIFVDSDDKKQNRKNEQESTSKTQKEVDSDKEEAMKKAQAQAERRIQQQKAMDQIQNKVQNNQLNQNTDALKQQMEHDLKKKRETENQFRKNVAANKEFQKMHARLVSQGFNMTEASFDAKNSTDGTFKVEYRNGKGEKAAVKGEMHNLNMTNISKEIVDENKAIQYKKDVKRDNKNKDFWKYLLFLAAAVIMIYFVLRRFLKKKHTLTKQEKDNCSEKDPDLIDFRKESLKIISKAERIFTEGDDVDKKEAYKLVSYAVRFYYSHLKHLKKEIIGSELVDILRKERSEHLSRVKEMLLLCSMVEFAKYKPSKKDFDKIVEIAKSVVK